jgi:hypothetical protein
MLPERTAQEILAGEVPVRLGGQRYLLRELSIAANRQWKAGLEGSLVGLLDGIDAAGDELGTILAVFATATDQLLDALYAYDEAHDERGQASRAGLLPPRRQLEEHATASEVLLATLGVWQAANPFGEVALGLARAVDASPLLSPTRASSTPTNGARRSTAGRRRTSSAS